MWLEIVVAIVVLETPDRFEQKVLESATSSLDDIIDLILAIAFIPEQLLEIREVLPNVKYLLPDRAFFVHELCYRACV